MSVPAGENTLIDAVTGAGKGIGRACALAFFKLGATVILNGQSEVLRAFESYVTGVLLPVEGGMTL